MKRRIALKQIGFMTAGAMLLPSCMRQARQVSIALKNIVVTVDQETLLAEIAGTIIPTTDTPGAKDMNIHEFVLRMVDDCQDAETQQQFVTGLSQMEEAVRKRFNKSFEDCTGEERIIFLREVEEKNNALKKDEKKETEVMKDGRQSEVAAFYSLAKRYTVQGFLSSEYIMTNVLVYNMIPGKFQGCVQIKDKNDIQTVIG